MKRRISAILVGAMVLTAFAGCGKKETKATDAATASDAKVVEMATGLDALNKRIDGYEKVVTLGDYEHIVYTPTHTEVTDDMIQSEITALKSQYQTTEEVTDRAAANGDIANIDYVGTIDDKEFDGGSAQGYDLELGSHSFIDTFEDQIVGHKIGDKFDVNVTFPESYGNTELAGKPAKFAVTLNKLSIKKDPEYNDEFIASVTDSKSVKEYEEKTRKDYEEYYANADKESDKNTVLLAAIGACEVSEYPQDEVNNRIATIKASVESSAKASNVSYEDYIQNYGYTAEKFESELKTSAEQYLKEKMSVCVLARKLGITVTEEEKQAKVAEMIQNAGASSEEELNSYYGYDDDFYYVVVMEEKMVDILMKNAIASATDASPADATTTDAK